MGLRLIRYVLPAVIVLAGALMMALTGPEDERYVAGGAMIGAGLAVALVNLMFRIGVAGDREREDEERAREHFDRHGRWPDE